MNVPEDLEDLVNLRITGEQGLACAHLGEDTTDRPHIDTGRVLTTAKQDLRRTIPQCDDLVGVSAEWNTKGASETEICQFQVAVAVDE